MTRTVLVTGATGFVGGAIVAKLLQDDATVHCAVRRAGAWSASGARLFAGLELTSTADWAPALAGADAVIHCAARVHVMREHSADPAADFHRSNVTGTLRLAEQAAAAGVERFVFLSSIGVSGAETFGEPFRPSDVPSPHSPYAASKLAAELELQRLAARTGLAVTIVRAPLVYGPNAPGNFGTLLRFVNAGLPLPLGSVDNRRSFVAIDNLVDLVILASQHAGAAGRTLLVSDGEDLSTTELLRRLASALGRPSHLIPVPATWLRRITALLGRPELGQRLCGSLQVDISVTRQLLGWEPPVSVKQALVRLAQHFLAGLGR